MNWIAVSTGIARDAKVGAIADACRCSVPQAVGHVMGVLLAIPDERPDANLSTVPDATLETWAMWTGRRGMFAKAFRAAWCVDGVVASWEKWNGAKQREAKQARDRAREWRAEQRRARENGQREAEGVLDEPRSVRHTHGVTNEATNDERTPTYRRQVTEGVEKQREVDIPSPPPPALLHETSGWVAPFGHDALATLLAHAPDPVVWVGILRGIANGQTMDHNRPCDRERLAVALVDFVAKGKHREDGGPSARLFRSFVKSARAPERKYADQQTAEEHKAELLATIRRSNERLRRMGRPEKPLPPWAAEIDALFPDGRTFPHDLPGSAA